MQRAKALIIFSMLLICCYLASNEVDAGGFVYVSPFGVPSAWDNTKPIVYHPEDGRCGPYTNEEILLKIEDDLNIWSSLPEVDLSFMAVTGQLGEVNVDNYQQFIYLGGQSQLDLVSDGLNPVIFDDDAEIMAEIGGEANKYLMLGFASVVGFSNDLETIKESQAVLNCRCLQDHPSGPCLIAGNPNPIPIVFSDTQFSSTVVHEFGHALNLDHSQVNFQNFSNGNKVDDNAIPLMFPYAFNLEEPITPRRDDISALAALYPTTDFLNQWCLIKGNLLDSDGHDLMCVDVWVEDGNSTHTVGQVSGTLATGTDNNGDGDIVDSGECDGDCGYFEIYAKPGNNLAINLYNVDTDYTGSRAVGPCFNEQPDLTIEGQNIANISTAQCKAGATINLGDIQTTINGNGSSGSGAGQETGNGNETLPSSGCSLRI